MHVAGASRTVALPLNGQVLGVWPVGCDSCLYPDILFDSTGRLIDGVVERLAMTGMEVGGDVHSGGTAFASRWTTVRGKRVFRLLQNVIALARADSNPAT